MNVAQLAHLLTAHGNAALRFRLPAGDFIPQHFHITEVGRVERNFVDCGGTRRQTVTCLLQVWTANDVQHRLSAGKLAKILQIAEPILGTRELPVAVEYGPEVASQYALESVAIGHGELILSLAGKQTACLALEQCGVGECNTNGCCP